MNSRLLPLLGSVFSLFFALPSSAQREVRVRGLALQPGVPEELQAGNAAGKGPVGVVKVKSFLNHEFDTLKLEGNQLNFTAVAAGGPAEEIGSCEIPAKAASVILVFLPVAPDSKTCRIVVVEDSAKAFPPGSYKIANLSEFPMKIELEKKEFEFKAGEIRSIEDPPVGANQASGMRGFSQREGEWQAFVSSIWPHPGGKRVLQLVTANPATGQLEMRGVRDIAKP
jgi:hypothetical protein